MRIHSRLTIAFMAPMLLVLFTGCVSAPPLISKGAKFPLMYEEKPHVLLVLPPINATTAADAKEYYSTTVAIPLASSGFYVLPIEVTTDILKSQGLYDTEILGNQPLGKFREYFGADAVLFTKINKWDTAYAILASTLTVSVEAKLMSTRTDRELWAYTGTVVVDLSGSNTSSGNPLADLIAKAIVTAISTAVADYVPVAQQANFLLLAAIPAGRYHYRHNQDQADQIRDLLPGDEAPAPAAVPQSQTPKEIQ